MAIVSGFLGLYASLVSEKLLGQLKPRARYAELTKYLARSFICVPARNRGTAR